MQKMLFDITFNGYFKVWREECHIHPESAVPKRQKLDSVNSLQTWETQPLEDMESILCVPLMQRGGRLL